MFTTWEMFRDCLLLVMMPIKGRDVKDGERKRGNSKSTSVMAGWFTTRH